MMKIEEVVGDLILLILDNHEPLKKIGIETCRIEGKESKIRFNGEIEDRIK